MATTMNALAKLKAEPGFALTRVPIPTLGPTDVLIRVPIATSHVGSDRLFGDEIIFWLRREGDRYKIYRTLEDFQLN